MILAAAFATLAFAQQSLPAEASTLAAKSDAWDACLNRWKVEYEPSGEPANAVATAALWSCQGEFAEMFDAVVAYKVAAVPGRSAREVRLEEVENIPLMIQSREWRLTKDIVEIRLARRRAR